MTLLEWSSLVFSFLCIYQLVRTFGLKLNIQESIAGITCLVYLVMPVVAYNIFNEKSKLAVLWQTTMPISSDEYFAFALPGVIALTLGLIWPFGKRLQYSDKELLNRVEDYLMNKSFIGYLFISIGVFSGVILPYMPPSLFAAVYFANQLLYIGVIYLLFSHIRFKWGILLMALVFQVLRSINTGMYGSMIFWGFLILLYLLLKGRQVKTSYKLLILCLGLFFIFLIQSIKIEYRDKTWRDQSRTGDANFFFSLVGDRLSNPLSVFEYKRLYEMATRGNQGFLLARTMDYVPKKEPFADGETIIRSVEASIVPRFLWKDKPELGGVENTCRFLGDCTKRFYSYNIGQIGEAYANFGIRGGILFLFFYGLFTNWSIYLLKKASSRTPSIILWLPLMFFASLSLETDVLTFLNTLIKGFLFCLFIYAFFRYVLKWRI